MMPADELAAIRARDAEATPGPWMLSGKRADYEEDYVWCVVDQSADNPYHPVAQQLAEGYGIGQVCAAGSQENWPADRVFIAHARQDIPALLADHDALVAENARLRAGIAGLRLEHENRDCPCGYLQTCPASPELSIWRRAREEPICDCGAAEHNAKVDALLAGPR